MLNFNENMVLKSEKNKPLWMYFDDEEIQILNYNLKKDNLKIKNNCIIYNKHVSFHFDSYYDNEYNLIIELIDISLNENDYFLIVKDNAVFFKVFNNNVYETFKEDSCLFYLLFLSIYTKQTIYINKELSYKDLFVLRYDRFLNLMCLRSK